MVSVHHLFGDLIILKGYVVPLRFNVRNLSFVFGLVGLLIVACGGDAPPAITASVVEVAVPSQSIPAIDDSTGKTSTASDDDEAENTTSSDDSVSSELSPGRSTLVVEQMLDGVPIRRTFIVHAPSELDSTRKYPVLMVFHGYSGSGDSFAYQLSRFVEAGEFIGIYPNGTGPKPAWNIGNGVSTADDLGFVQEIIEMLGEYEQLDVSGLSAAGVSMGAAMVHILAGHTDHLSSAAAVVTQLHVGMEPDRSTGPVSILQINGMRDRTAAYEGGESPVGTFYAAEKSAEIWALHNSCAAVPEITTTGSGNRKVSYSDCEGGVEVVHYGITEGQHSLPEGTEGDLWGLIWRFLKKGSSN